MQIATDEFSLLDIRILSLPPSSAGLQRVLSSIGLVYSDVLNRLGHEKATKLAVVMLFLRLKKKQSLVLLKCKSVLIQLISLKVSNS